VLAEAFYDGNKSELARALDMSPGSFTKYTRGERMPGAQILERLTRMGVNLNWFLTGEGPMTVGRARSAPASSSGQIAHKPGAAVSATDLLGDPNKYYPIPMVRVRVGREGDLCLDNTGEWEWMSGEHIRRRYGVEPGRLRSFYVSWNQMADTLRPGDRVRGALCPSDVSLDQLGGGTVCLLLGPEGVFGARLYKDEEADAVVLVGDNPEVDDREVSRERWEEAYKPIARILDVVRTL
jgi:hypothetical protein